MALKFTVDTSGMDDVKRALASVCTKAEHNVAEMVEKDTVPFVPALTGSLMLRTRTHPERNGELIGSTIIYPAPYARFLYYGKVMVDPTTGSTYAPKNGTKVVTDRNLVFSKAMHPQAQSHWFEASKAQNLGKWVRAAKKAVEKFGKD